MDPHGARSPRFRSARRATLAAAVTSGLALLVPLLAAPSAPAAPAGATATASPAPTAQDGALSVAVLSNRADLLSGGDALVEVELPAGVRENQVQVRVIDAGGTKRDVTDAFARRAGGRYLGVVEGIGLGEATIEASARGQRDAIDIVMHPNGGPVFSGPQHEPYQCQAGARDRLCNQPATYSWLYKSTDPAETDLKPYDPENPPSDVATTTTDEGVEVPFVVRREDGFQARDRYSILTLRRPGQDWRPWRPQEQWNHKVLITHGGNCGASYTPGSPRLQDYSGTLEEVPGVTPSYVTGLGRGFAVVSTALANTGHNCNVSVEAESLVMAKERLVEQYGEIRYTIGTGCSGGSIAQHTIANAYPGVYQGLVTTCSYPDTLTAGAQFADYHLLRQYFEDPSRWAPGVVWSPTQMAAVEGHLSHANAVVADEGLFKAALNPENPCPGTKDTVAGDESTRYDDETNPGGVRCSVLDIMKNLIGPRPESAWGAEEQAAGHGFAGVPLANTGIVYGLGALKQGQITPEQLVDLNEKIGGLDVDSRRIDERTSGDAGSIAKAYRTGLINEMGNIEDVAIINHGGPDPGIAHDYAHAFWTEERMMAAQGHTDNRVMWFGATPLIGDPGWANEALIDMDRWLAAVEGDGRSVSLAQKVAEDRPDDVTDRCANVEGLEQVPGPDGEPLCQQSAVETAQTRLSTPRQVAGGPTANDNVACELRPFERADLGTAGALFTPGQVQRLEELFAEGVCDWSRPGRGTQATRTWLRYDGADGGAEYGGRELGAVPARSAGGVAGPAFQSMLRN